jgi:hypothetical protein
MTTSRRNMRVARRAIALLACFVTGLAAQQAVLPLDDIAYAYIDAMQNRGLLRGLPIIERPYSVGAVRLAIATERSATPSASTLRWLSALEAAAEKYAPGVTATDSGVFSAGVAGYGVLQSSGTRDLMQSDRRSATAPGFTVRALLQSGAFTGAMRVVADQRMKVDPEYFGRKDRVLSGRTEDAYIGVASKFATLQVGRVGRSWGLPGQLGLMVSNGAYTYDHLFARIGTDKIHLSTVVARLDDERRSFSTDTLAQRFFTAHRLSFGVGQVEAGISESVIYGGVNSGFRPSLAAPTAPLFLSQYSDAEQINIGFGADVLWRKPNGIMLGAQLFVDDFQIDQCELCGEPPGIATTLIADGIPVSGSARAFASYTRVTALTYRAPDRFERYTYRTVGLGQRNSDFDEIRLGLDLGPVLPMPVRAYVAYRRQGAGDYREPYPAITQRSTWPTIFEGVVVKTLRMAATGSMRVGSSIELAADAGVNRIANDLRVPGALTTRFDGRLRVALEPTWSRFRAGLF